MLKGTRARAKRQTGVNSVKHIDNRCDKVGRGGVQRGQMYGRIQTRVWQLTGESLNLPSNQ